MCVCVSPQPWTAKETKEAAFEAVEAELSSHTLIMRTKQVSRTLSYSSLAARLAANAALAGAGSAAEPPRMAAAAAAAAQAAPSAASRCGSAPDTDPDVASEGDRPSRGRGVELGRRRAPNSTVRVLSVDDDPVNQMVMKNLLEPVGYEVCLVAAPDPFLKWAGPSSSMRCRSWRSPSPRTCLRLMCI